MERTGALEEPISPELVLVDGDLAARAREALPPPPSPRPAVAQPRQRVAEPSAPEAPPARPRRSFSRRVGTLLVWAGAAVALAAVASLALELVKDSPKPTLATRSAEPPAPAPAKTSTGAQAPSRSTAHSAVKPSPTRKAKSKPVPTTSPRRSAPPAAARKHAPKPAAPAAVKVERALSWRPVRGAAYYEVLLQRGSATVYEARTSKRTASIRVKLKPGTYRAVVRPAMPNDAGITLGPAIVHTIVEV